MLFPLLLAHKPLTYMFRSLPVLLPGILLLASCANNKEVKLGKGVGINVAYMDTTVNPADDFFTFVNGNWVATTQIPADQGRWGSFGELGENTRNAVLSVLKDAGAGDQYKEGSDQRKAADFFAIGMDSLQAENMKLKPIQPYLEKIDAISNKKDLQQYLADQQKVDGGAFFNLAVNTDLKKSDEVALYLNAGGLGLPERDYYTKTDDKSKEIREKYVAHISEMLTLADVSSKGTPATAIMKIETALATGSMTKEERRNPDKRYNKRAVGDMANMVPSIDWKQYLTDVEITGIDSVIVGDVGYMAALENVLSKSSLEDIKAYLRWRLIDRTAPFLHYALVQADFAFNTKYLRGIDALRPRWKRVLDATNGAVGEAIGKLYVEKNFPPEAKAKAMQMVDNIKLAFADRIRNLDWMSDSTKEKALKKLSTFSVKIAYPDEWRDYSRLVVEKNPEKGSYAQNVMNAQRFNFNRQISKLGKPVDRKEWRMTPQTVNAYYNPTFNEIVFPAAILQPPFYDYRADEAVNYGGIGAVIGHEISHGFDDQGSKFDAAGNLKNWWSAEDLKRFQEKGKAYAEQFNKYEPLPGVFVQGQFTLGENIGDLGGVTVAYEGLQRHLKEHGNPGLIEGYTPEQRFFISWATIWRTKYKDESLRTQVLTDPHSPGMYRSNGPLTNFPEFYKAFNVKEGNKMFRPESERVKIW
jgi:putative endopeptidase